MRPNFHLAAQTLRIAYAVFDPRPEKFEEEKTPMDCTLTVRKQATCLQATCLQTTCLQIIWTGLQASQWERKNK